MLQLEQARGSRAAARMNAWKIAHLGSCHLEKYPWEVAAWGNTLGRLPLGKISWEGCHLGKYSWKVAAWENTLGRLPLWKMSFGNYLINISGSLFHL